MDINWSRKNKEGEYSERKVFLEDEEGRDGSRVEGYDGKDQLINLRKSFWRANSWFLLILASMFNVFVIVYMVWLYRPSDSRCARQLSSFCESLAEHPMPLFLRS